MFCVTSNLLKSYLSILDINNVIASLFPFDDNQKNYLFFN